MAWNHTCSHDARQNCPETNESKNWTHIHTQKRDTEKEEQPTNVQRKQKRLTTFILEAIAFEWIEDWEILVATVELIFRIIVNKNGLIKHSLCRHEPTSKCSNHRQCGQLFSCRTETFHSFLSLSLSVLNSPHSIWMGFRLDIWFYSYFITDR